MHFDQHTVILLTLDPDAPVMTDKETAALQDAHLAYTADMIEQGHVMAAGPAVGPDAGRMKGISVWSVDADAAGRLCAQDPAVRAGRLTPQILTWMVPSGQLLFRSVRAPRTTAEATEA
ncbi:YciI family protein [Streptomyces mirabilis]|uniref:YciI family protein n=1 Tax=Streptomyces mirabilis TaxID=68239 RepID=UPI0038221587